VRPATVTATAAALALTNVTVAYRGHPAVHHVSGRFELGTATALVGPNGGGKSSLMAALAGLVRPGHAATLEGRIERATGASVAYLPQAAELDRSFPVRVADLVAMGLWGELGAFRPLQSRHRERVSTALEAVGLRGFEHRWLGEMSTGQLQRALFARVLVQDARIILLDEPFNAIDARTTTDLLALLPRWRQEARTVIAVLHDLEQVKAYFDQALLLAREPIAWGPTAQVLRAEHWFRARQMAEAWDEAAALCEGPAQAATAPSPSTPHAHAHEHAHEHGQ
jgi:zinc/manganese transport system ATP-binding protein